MTDVLDRTLEFFTFEHQFTLMALLACVLVGICGAVLGVFVVLRQMSLLGDAAGHATLPGIAGAFLLTGTSSTPVLYAGAALTALASSLMVIAIRGRPRSRPDAAIGVSLASFFGLGIVLLSYAQHHSSGGQAKLLSFLFGNAAGVKVSELWFLGVVCCLSVAGVIVFWRALEVSTFDPDWAISNGFPVRLIEAIVLGWISLVIVVSISTTGAVLVSAMLVIPPTFGLLTQSSLKRATIAAGVAGLVTGVVGAWASFVFEGVASGPAMVLAGATLLLVTLFAVKVARKRP